MILRINEIINSLYSKRAQWFVFFRDLFFYFYFRVYLFFIVLANFLTWLLAYRIIKNLSPENDIVLHYNVDFGINMMGAPKQILIIPLLGDLIFVFNIVIIGFLDRYSAERRFSRHLVMLSSLIVNILLLATVLILNFVNIDQ